MSEPLRRKLFVIEDNRTEGMLFRLALSSIPGIDISYFSTGKELLDELDQKPDIALVDLMLPDITGFELIEKIKQDSPETSIIVASAQKDIDVIAQVQNLGVFNYLVKSEGCLSYLQDVVRNLLIIHDSRIIKS